MFNTIYEFVNQENYFSLGNDFLDRNKYNSHLKVSLRTLVTQVHFYGGKNQKIGVFLKKLYISSMIYFDKLICNKKRR